MPTVIQTVQPGNGINFPVPGDRIKIHYTGSLKDGRKFDSSWDREEPFVTHIGIGRVIQGWDEGIVQLSLGETALLTIPPELGYGARGFPPLIPPHATLIFHVKLLQIN